MSLVSTKLNEQEISNNDETKRETQTLSNKSLQKPESDGCENVPVKYTISGSESNYVLPPVDESLIEDDCFPLITSVYSLANLDSESKMDEGQLAENSTYTQQSYPHLPDGNSCSNPPDLSKPVVTKEQSAVEEESNSCLKMVCKKGCTEYSDITNTLSASLAKNGTNTSKDKQLAASKEQAEQFHPSAEHCVAAKGTIDNKTDNALSPKAGVSSLIDLGQTKYGPMNSPLKSNGSQQAVSGQPPAEEPPQPGKSTSSVENTIGDASPLSRLEKRMTELVSTSQPVSMAGQTSVSNSSTKVSTSTNVSPQQKLIKTSTPRGTFLLNVPVDTQTVYIIHYQDGTRFFTVPQGTSLSAASINALAQGQQVVIQKAVLPPNTTNKSIPQPIAPKPDSTLVTTKPSVAVQMNSAPVITVQSQSTVGLPLEKSRANLFGDSVPSKTAIEQQKNLILNTQVVASSSSQTVASHSGTVLETSSLDELNRKKDLSGTLSSPQSDSVQHQNNETKQILDKINVSTPSLVSSSEKPIVPRSLFPAENSESSVSTSSDVSSFESTVKTDSGGAESPLPSSGKDSMETGLTPHEVKIQRLKELMREQEEALEKLREKRKREVDSVRESALIKDSNSATRGQINLGSNDSVSQSGPFLTPAPPKSSTPFARNFQRTRDLDELPSAPAKKQKKTEALGNAIKSPRVSTANTRTEENVAFVPNGEDQKFVRLVGLETVVSGLSNKENCDKLDR